MRTNLKTISRRSAFTLTELIVVIIIISLFLLLATPNLLQLLRRGTFEAQVQDFVSAMRMAANAAAESSRRYEVIIDVTEQAYMLREITSPDLSEILEEEVIIDNYFSDKCWVSYVMFDDGDYTNDGMAKFRVGHAGWQYGGKIVLLDDGDQEYSVVVNRLGRTIELKQGDVELPWPKAKEDVSF